MSVVLASGPNQPESLTPDTFNFGVTLTQCQMPTNIGPFTYKLTRPRLGYYVLLRCLIPLIRAVPEVSHFFCSDIRIVYKIKISLPKSNCKNRSSSPCDGLTVRLKVRLKLQFKSRFEQQKP